MTTEELHKKLAGLVGEYSWKDKEKVWQMLSDIGLHTQRKAKRICDRYWLADVEDQDKPVIVLSMFTDVKDPDNFALFILTNVINQDPLFFAPEVLPQDFQAYI